MSLEQRETKAVLMTGVPQKEIARDATTISLPQGLLCFTRKWYFSREEIECHTPSRADGIDYKSESHLRKLYCSFLQELGMELKVPRVTIAAAIMFCHRFYMRQSHAKNDWQTIATASMFLACKAEETPRWLGELVQVAYRLIYKWDPLATRRIRDKQKELIVAAERLLLATTAFELNIEHLYKPLIAALKRLDLPNKDIVRVAWNFVNDWLRMSLCLQHKPHYIAAGSVFLAARFQKQKLPTEKGKVWWMQFDVSPKHLEGVIQQMLGLLENNRKQALPSKDRKGAESSPIGGKTKSNSPKSCSLSGSISQDSKLVAADDSGRLTISTTSMCMEAQDAGVAHEILKETIISQTSDCGSADSVVEDSTGEPATGKSDQDSIYNIASVKGGKTQIDANRIRETLKRRKSDRSKNKKFLEFTDDEIDGEAWIERELENGIEADSPATKKHKVEVL